MNDETFEVAELAEDLDSELQPKEPRLKYRSVSHGLTTLTSTDTITCMAAHGKFLAVGTALGRVHVFDHSGYTTENGVHSMHRGPVNQICVSVKGDHMASCGDDRRVVVYNLSDMSENEVFHMDHEVKSIAIAPDYLRSPIIAFGYSKLMLRTRGVLKRSKHGEVAKASGLIRTIKWRETLIVWADDAFVGVYDVRDHQTIAYVQFGQHTQTPRALVPPCHISWCTDTCFLLGRGQSVAICQILERYQSADRRTSSKSSLRRSSISNVSTDSDAPVGVANRFLELSYQLNLADSLVCGISRHQTQILVLLVSGISTVGQLNEIPLELQMIEVDDMETVQSSMRRQTIHCEQPKCSLPKGTGDFSNISLESVPDENTYYIVTPKELICAEELTVDDRIDWLLSHGEYVQALQVANSYPRFLVKHSTQSVGVSYIDYLLEIEQFTMAARMCAEILSERSLWEALIHKFIRRGQLPALVPFIPTGQIGGWIKLDPSVYEEILCNCMQCNPQLFLSLLSSWCKLGLLDSYDGLLRVLVDHIEHHMSLSGISEVTVLEPGLRSLWQSLAVLYDVVGSPEKSLDILVQLRDPKVFELFEKKSSYTVSSRLIEVLKERVVCFMDLDAPKAVSILLDHVSIIPVEYVIAQLETKPELLYQYLYSAYLTYPKLVSPYMNQLIQLSTQFGRDKLLPLLRSTDSYSLSEALSMCERAKLVPETVYLLTRVGRRHDALQLIMTQGGDTTCYSNGTSSRTVEERQCAAAAAAIAYCCEEDAVHSKFNRTKDAPTRSIFGVRLDNHDSCDVNDPNESNEPGDELWQQVVLFAVDKPAFICALLQHAGPDGLDPRLLLRKISPDMSIPGLRDSLVKLMRNYKLQLELQRNCRRIVRTDAYKLLHKLIQEQSRGVYVASNGFASVDCVLCTQQLIKPRGSSVQVSKTSPNTDGPAVFTVFRCKHVCHNSCLPSGDPPACPLCAKF